MVSEACTIPTSGITAPIPDLREKLNVRPSGFTGRRRLPAFIDWDELERMQVKHGISEYCAVKILGYSLTSFYRHKKLRKEGLEIPYVPPKIIENDVDAVEELQCRTGWTQKACIENIGVSNTTFHKHRKMRDEGIALEALPGAACHRDETVDERFSRYLNSRVFMRKRKCRHNPCPKPRTRTDTKIDVEAIDEMVRRRKIPGYKWVSRHHCAQELGYASTTYYRQLKLLNDDTKYDRGGRRHMKHTRVKLEKGTLSRHVSI